MLAVKGICGAIFAICCAVARPVPPGSTEDFSVCVQEVQKDAESLLSFYENEARTNANQLQENGLGQEIFKRFPTLPNCTSSERPGPAEITGVLRAFREHFHRIQAALASTALEGLRERLLATVEGLNCPPTASLASAPLAVPKLDMEVVDIKEGLYYTFDNYKNCSTLLSAQVKSLPRLQNHVTGNHF